MQSQSVVKWEVETGKSRESLRARHCSIPRHQEMLSQTRWEVSAKVVLISTHLVWHVQTSIHTHENKDMDVCVEIMVV